MAKALLIKSSTGTKENVQGNWHLFDQTAPYIQGIETGDLIENINSDVLNSMISGLPNIWSRTNVFYYAFKYTQKDFNIKTSGLIKFYEALIKEWKGLLALLALYPDRVTVSEPIKLVPQPNEPLFDISSSLGRMLFEDTDLWCDPDSLYITKKEEPFIQLIYYQNVLIGATSPYTLLFTAVDYRNFPSTNDITWFRNGKFDDPLEFGNLKNDQIQKLYLLVKNLAEKLPEFEKKLQINRFGKENLELGSIYVFLQNWLKEIKSKGYGLVEEGVLDAELIFSKPFMPLFRVKQELYHKDGIFSFKNDFGGEVIDLQKILLQDEFLFTVSQTDENQPLSESAIHYLKALDPEDPYKYWYFPIPVSSYGLKVFKNKIGDLVAPSKDNIHELRALIKPVQYKVNIELYLFVDGKKQTPIVKEYEIKHLTGAQRNVIMWPNFISKDWNSYYLFSEYPSNSRDIKIVPFYKNFSLQGGFDAGEYIENEQGKLVYADEKTLSLDFNAVKIIKYPVEIATSDDHPYEVIRSNKPIAGLEIRSLINGKERICGYLIVKNANDESMLDKKLLDLSYETNFEDVVVGIDFGSNNSCLNYSQTNRVDVMPIPFKNRRIFLLGAEVLDPRHEKTALRNELLFFQNESSPNGQVKSWIHDHNQKYIPQGMEQEEISGGVPIFEPNIVIHDMDNRTITTNAGTLHHSMKWLSDIKGKEKKKAYLKTVWVKAVADLFANRLIPKELRWSYPGAFSQFDKLQYQQMYNELSEIPVENKRTEVTSNPSTESEAVCNYALTHVGLSERNILLGIDVGGSTSDVLVVAMDRAARAFKLKKQSSLRLAAGVLSDVIKNSPSIINAVYRYHESPACKFKVANIKNMIEKPKTAPFYFNAILDRLKDEDFDGFYRALAQACPEIFAIPAYVSGLLLYYSGQLVAKTITENNYTEINFVDFLPFGKGGRIFDWLDTYPGKQLAEQYFTTCFKTGYGANADKISIAKKYSIRKDNKSEVSIGLSAPQKVTVDENAREDSDIVGEAGYKYYAQNSNAPVELKADDIINSKYLEEMDFGISLPTEFNEFNKFFEIFIDFVGPRKTGIIKNTAVIEQKKTELARELKAFILNDNEWQKADEQRKSGQPFEYQHSLFVLEGMCFLDKFIIPLIVKI